MKERIINIGPRLKQRRKEMRIKQTEMAKELGVSQTYLSNIEGGRTNCSITLFVDICNYLNVTPDYLMLGNMRGNRASIDINEQLDPKCDWAIRHLGQFPVEVQNASYDMLLRIPGIGPKSARRIVETRRYAKLDFDILKKIGVVLKRAHYFITCNGRMMYRIPIEESYITSCLTDDNHKENWEITHQNEKYQQLSLFE